MSKDKNVKDNIRNRRKKSSKKTARPIIKKAPSIRSLSDRREDMMQETSEIPTFDLAEQIMAEHRKMSAVRRKGPGKMAKPPQKKHPAELIARNVVTCPALGPEQVITEIVARDIENLCIRKTP